MQRIVHVCLAAVEIATLSALILSARCANYRDVFVAGNTYFTDADCYARMTRVRMCGKTPGLIIRHHDFENFPEGTTPHTTAPFDYLILALAVPLRPFTTDPLDLAGAFISPLLALLGGWFLWWWSRQMKFRYGWAMLILYAISPILVQGTKLGRPDHQSLIMLLITIAICAEWTSRTANVANNATSHGIRESRIEWRPSTLSTVGGVTWALAIWVSAYEPLLLFLLVITAALVIGIVSGPPLARHFLQYRRIGWIWFGLIIAIAVLTEQRIPSFTISQSNEIFKNWAGTIGELTHVSPTNPVWFRWAGYMIAVAPILIYLRLREREVCEPGGSALPIYVLLLASYLLTVGQARWGYFFVLIFAIALPALLEPIKSRTAVLIAFTLSIFPILRDWDARLWPNEAEFARRIEQRNELIELRELALNLRSPETHPFLAPWWLSSAIAYWSEQPGVAGSSHESLNGIAASARFYLSDDWQRGRKILEDRHVAWIFAYDAERLAQNSSAILGLGVPDHPVCFVLDRTPARVPPLLLFSAQNGTGKLYRSVER